MRMTDDGLYQSCAPQVLHDPAVVAAQDQLRAAAADISQSADAAEDQALGPVLAVIVRRALDAMGVPPRMVPEVIEHAARYIERRFAVDSPADE